MSRHDDEEELLATIDRLVHGFVYYTQPTSMQASQVRLYLGGLATENDLARHLLTKYARRNRKARELLEDLSAIHLPGEPYQTSARRAAQILNAATPHS